MPAEQPDERGLRGAVHPNSVLNSGAAAPAAHRGGGAECARGRGGAGGAACGGAASGRGSGVVRDPWVARGCRDSVDARRFVWLPARPRAVAPPRAGAGAGGGPGTARGGRTAAAGAGTGVAGTAAAGTGTGAAGTTGTGSVGGSASSGARRCGHARTIPASAASVAARATLPHRTRARNGSGRSGSMLPLGAGASRLAPGGRAVAQRWRSGGRVRSSLHAGSTCSCRAGSSRPDLAARPGPPPPHARQPVG